MIYKSKNDRKKERFLKGLVYGLIPHIGCIAFIVFSILGVTTATAFFKPFLLNPYFFHGMVVLAIVFATISAFFYFKKQGFITVNKIRNGLEISFLPSGLKRKWKYLLTLYGTTVSINLILFLVVFPIVANISPGSTLTAAIIDAFGGSEESQLLNSGSLITLQVVIPCPGHAPLIMGELKTVTGVEGVRFKFPNLFDVGYSPEVTSKEQILSLDVFKTYKATIISEDGETGDIQLVDSTGQPQLSSNSGSCCDGSSGGGCGCGCGR